MMIAKIPESMEELAVPIDSVFPYPGNARKGDIEAIAESLDLLSQYRPIVVDQKTRYVLAGNHTRYAAQSLGWTHIAAVLVDVTEDQARRIVLADNRLGDLGDMDLDALLVLLERDGGDIGGTGYTDEEVKRIASQLEANFLFGEAERESVGNAANLEDGELGSIQLGPYRFEVEEAEFLSWAQEMESQVRDSGNADMSIVGMGEEPYVSVKDIIRQRLGLQGAQPIVFKKTKNKKIAKAPKSQTGQVSNMNISLSPLKMYPGNARRGDISAIADSLSINSQYRPIVVSSRTLHILSGNHTYLAAMALGWSEIAAVLLDVDHETERLIVLADNKLAQRSSYDMPDLMELLKEVAGDPTGTGFNDEDISEILGKADEEAAANARVWVAVRHRPTEINWRIPCSASGFQDWIDELRKRVGSSDEAVRDEVRRLLLLGKS